MGKVQNSIGLRWERVLQDRYPGLASTVGDVNVPDFYHSSGFWIEAKAGNVLWGGRIKQYQLDQIRDFPEPVVYAFGMHNLDNAMSRVGQRTERGRQKFLEENLEFVETYFISSKIVEKIFEKEKRVSDKGLIYCMVKPSLLRNIILNRTFSRMGNKVDSSDNFYGFERAKHDIGTQFGGGYVLDSEKEKIVADFLLKRN